MNLTRLPIQHIPYIFQTTPLEILAFWQWGQ